MKMMALSLALFGLSATAAQPVGEATQIDPKEKAELTLKAPDKLKGEAERRAQFSHQAGEGVESEL